MSSPSRKRKLKYIREKNHYRSGGACKSLFKISTEMVRDSGYVHCAIKAQYVELSKRLQIKFKMKFDLLEVESGRDGDDFVTDLVTIRLTLRVAA